MRASLDLPTWAAGAQDVTVSDTKPHSSSPTKDPASADFVPHSIYILHEFVVPSTKGEAKWPEASERKREWVPFDEAARRVAWRRGMGDAMRLAPVNQSPYLS